MKWPAALGERKIRRFYLSTAAIFAAGAAWVGICFPRSDGTPLLSTPICLSHQLLGISCPGCGTTRAFTLMLRGRVVDALWMNASGVLIFTALAVLGICLCADVATRFNRLYAYRYYQWLNRQCARWWVIALAVLLMLCVGAKNIYYNV